MYVECTGECVCECTCECVCECRLPRGTQSSPLGLTESTCTPFLRVVRVLKQESSFCKEDINQVARFGELSGIRDLGDLSF